MNIKALKHGVHPYDGKNMSMNCAIRAIEPSGEMIYPLNQHIGAPAQSIVQVGDVVCKGQLIAKATGFVSSNIFSSVSGRVKAIKEAPSPSGQMVPSIIIDNDGNNTLVAGYGKECDYKMLSNEEILEKIQQSGIVGLGGAGFPTHAKLKVEKPELIEYVIINGAECEPYTTSDYRVMLEKGESIVKGTRIILKLFPNAKCYIAIEDNKPEAIKSLKVLTESENRIEVCALKTKYPQGGERMLIYSLTGRKINSSMLPLNAGCIVENVSTVVAIYDCVCRNVPLLERIVTVTGDGVSAPCNLQVPIGISFNQVLEAAGGLSCKPQKVICGGPMMGSAVYTLNVPVIKTTGSILVMSYDQVAQLQPSACIHCGRCVKACPEKLVPQMLMQASDGNDLDRFRRLGGMECIECGCCSYVCPAKRPLTQSFKYAKKKIQLTMGNGNQKGVKDEQAI